jgi:integrase
MLGMALTRADQEDIWQSVIAATRLIITGWRRSELLGLRWSEIDLPRRTARLADTKTGASLRALSLADCAVIDSQPRISDPVFPSRSSEKRIVGCWKMWSRITKLGDLPADITPHVLRHSFASLAADLGYNEPTIPTLLGHKTHSITSRYVHSADAVLLAAADAVANATMKLMASDEAQPQLRDQRRDGSVVWDEFTSFQVFSSHRDGGTPTGSGMQTCGR